MRLLELKLLSTCAYGIPATLLSASVLADAEAPPPPYVLTQAKGVVIGVTWEEAAVRKALPPGIRPVPDMSGGIVIYEVGEA